MINIKNIVNNSILKAPLFYLSALLVFCYTQEIPDEIKQKYIEKANAGLIEESNSSLVLPPKEEEILSDLNHLEREEIQNFGYNYFLNREKISIYDNLPVPGTYTFGPGDELIINIWGETQIQSMYTINREGNIYIDKLGLLSIVGKTLSQTELFLKKLYESVFSTMKAPNPTTFIDVSIGKLKTINVNIIGEVSEPGIHSVHPFSTISTAIMQSGGIKNTGTLRQVELIRNEEVIAKLDFYKMLILGQEIDDFRLQDGDLIYIPLRESSIHIKGHINRENTFELLSDENLGDLLSYAGGLMNDAQTKIEVNRIIPINKRLYEDFARRVEYVESTDENFLLIDGDELLVKKIHDVEQYVTIYGQVKRQGDFAYYEGMDIVELLEYAGGINDSTFKNSMNLNNIELIRYEGNSEYPTVLYIDLDYIKSNNIKDEYRLRNWDLIIVRPNGNILKIDKVFIDGQIISPGQYSIKRNKETLKDFIIRAGGYTNSAFIEGIKVYRDDAQVVLNNRNFILMADDSIFVPKHPGVVSVIGEVFHPGSVQYDNNKNLNYYVERAGGYTFDADKRKIVIIYANGDVAIKKRFYNPEIREGARIIVQAKEEVSDFNLTQFLKEIASILASLTTIIFIVSSNS